MKNKINKYLLFFSLLLIGCKEVDKYDLEKDYCDWIIVDKAPIVSGFTVTEGIEFTILKDNKYDKIILPNYYNHYNLGDTICSDNKLNKLFKQYEQ